MAKHTLANREIKKKIHDDMIKYIIVLANSMFWPDKAFSPLEYKRNYIE